MRGGVLHRVRTWREGGGGPRRGFRIAALILGAALGLVGCSSDELLRPARAQDELVSARNATDQRLSADRRALIVRNIVRVKAEHDAYAAGRAPGPPVIDFLIMSGGGDWGAFGAGVLKGWGTVTGPMARPTFDAVTGVSTGALIAPFAFIGDAESIERIVQMYRNPRKDWFQPRSLLAFVTGGASYGDVPGLEKDISQSLDETTLRRLVEGGKEGRILGVNTSNMDYGDMHAWDLVAEAQRALATGDKDRLPRILLASSAVPGAFPPREIDGNLYVDGAITGNILYGGRIPSEDGFVTVWKQTYPNIPVPKVRNWVIFNNQLRPPPEVVQPSWKAILPRSTTTATRMATVNSIRHLFALAEISRLKGADVEVRFIAVPDDWTPPKPGVFEKDVMNALADMGERMGADPASWREALP